MLIHRPRRRRARRASRVGIKLAEPDPPSRIRRPIRTMPPAASGRNGGLGPRACTALGVACVRRSSHQGKP